MLYSVLGGLTMHQQAASLTLTIAGNVYSLHSTTDYQPCGRQELVPGRKDAQIP